MSHASNNFRPDIEVLRGTAVILVVLFHLKFFLFKSGFVGVDIFFVISGYLMAAAFGDSSNTNIIQFYERRARRVLPAAFVVFFIFFITSPFLFLPFETKKVTESFLGTIFLAPNFVFWLENSYFDEFTFRPMLHYWSLGVEFQYYLAFPLIYYVFRNKHYLYLILLCASLLTCIYLTDFSSKTAFFLLPFRMWEFFLGFFAYHLSKKDIISKFSYANHISLAAIIAIIVFSLLPIPGNKFPGIYAFPPAFFAFLYITFGLKINSSYLFDTLSKPVRFIGKISYSIYLIHFPVIFIFIYAPFSEWKPLTGINAFFAVVITLFLSIIFYKFLETPFRNRKLISTKLFVQLVIAYLTTAISLVFIYSKYDYFANTYTPNEKAVFYSVDDQGKWRCDYIEKIKAHKNNSCKLIDSNAANKKFLLVGDSHMDAIKHLFVEKAKNSQSTVRLMKESCVLGEDKCNSTNLLNEAANFGITDIVLHSHFSDKFNYAELGTFIKEAQKTNIRVHFIDPIPTYTKSVPRILYGVLKNTDSLDKHTFSRDTFLSARNQKYHAFKNIHINDPNVFFYDASEYLCDPICEIKNETGIFYHDSHHLSLTGAKLLRPEIERIFSAPQ